MLFIIALACNLIVLWMFILSLLVIFRRPQSQGVVEERLDNALEIELMVAEIERIANRE
jgi:hypothetical protein